MTNPMAPPSVGEKWSYKPNRGSASFYVTKVDGERVTLRSWSGKHKTVSLSTLRGDYRRVSA